jgi:mannose/fructose/N-acetylgalactosamine-specific phosphotransferase system component IID
MGSIIVLICLFIICLSLTVKLMNEDNLYGIIPFIVLVYVVNKIFEYFT